MKKQISKIAFLALLSVGAFAQEKQTKSPQKVSITFKNNSVLPRKYTIITYSPDSEGNGTVGKMMSPNGTTDFKVLAGTKFYLADNEQVDVVMSGKKLSGKPFYIAKNEDEGKIINLRKD